MIDKRLTEKEKKKIKPANQGGGPNYLGKQETVTVPKKWLSDPDHVVAELAYITPREQKILLNANIYGSLKGKPNKGPGGIMSLQGDMGSVGGGGSPNGGNNDRPTMADIAGPVSTTTNTTTNSDSKFDPFNHSRFTVGSGYYGEPVTSPGSKETTINKFTPTFAPTVTKSSIWNDIKTIGKNLVKGYVATQTFGTLGLSPKAVAIGNTALSFGKKTGLTKSGSISELGLNTANSIGDMFGDRNIGDMFSGNNKGNTSTSNINNDIGNGGDGEGLASLENQASGYDEYLLLLQKLQSGNITGEERTRYTMLKNMLGI